MPCPPTFLQNIVSQYDGFYKCVHCYDPIDLFSLVICSALQARKFVMILYGRLKVIQRTSCSAPVRLSAFSTSSTS